MKLRDILTLVGSFFTGFGALVISQDVPKWFWWVGQAMTIIGPLLIGARVIGQSHKEEKEKQP